MTIPKRKRRLDGRLAAVGGAVLATWLPHVGPALAQAAEEVDQPEASAKWMLWVCMLAFVLLCCAIAFKNPKRSHQT